MTFYYQECLCYFLQTRNKYLISVTRLGNFLKFSATNFISKVAKIFGKLFGHFEMHLF